MTKAEILKELKSYGIEATLRPRKTILLELLERVRKEHKDGTLTSDVPMMDDIYYSTKEVTTEEWMEFTKVDEQTRILPGFLLFCLGVLIVYLWEDGVSFREMGGLLYMIFVISFLPLIAYFSERK